MQNFILINLPAEETIKKLLAPQLLSAGKRKIPATGCPAAGILFLTLLLIHPERPEVTFRLKMSVATHLPVAQDNRGFRWNE